MKDQCPPPSDPERGLALVIVLLVLILTSILALEIKASAALHMRLATNKRDDFLIREAMRGQLEVIKQVLLYDLREGDLDTLEDRWLEERYTQFQKGPEAAEDDRDPEEPITSQDIQLDARIEDEARKFNLHNLAIENDELRAHWEKVFVRLLVVFREDFSRVSISEAKAEELLKAVKEWLKRDDNDDGIPRPATVDEKRVMVTPDELLMVKGFTREILYDLPPEEEGEDSPPGLLRYLTLWSQGPVNLNTADPVVIYALFDEGDRDVADNFISWREEEAEEQPEDLALDAEPVKNALKSPQDLRNIEGFEDEILQRNRLNGATVTVRGTVFSIGLSGESPDGIRRQERWVLTRTQNGFRTILFETRNDPTYEKAEEEE